MTQTEMELKILQYELDIVLMKEELNKVKFEIYKLQNPNASLVDMIKFRNELVG